MRKTDGVEQNSTASSESSTPAESAAGTSTRTPATQGHTGGAATSRAVRVVPAVVRVKPQARRQLLPTVVAVPPRIRRGPRRK